MVIFYQKLMSKFVIKTIESLVKAGAFDSLGHTRKGLMAVYLEAIDSVMEAKRAEAIGQFDLLVLLKYLKYIALN